MPNACKSSGCGASAPQQRRTAEEHVGNLPNGGGQPRETGANTAYVSGAEVSERKGFGSPMEGPASHQVVGGVTAYQAYDG